MISLFAALSQYSIHISFDFADASLLAHQHPNCPVQRLLDFSQVPHSLLIHFGQLFPQRCLSVFLQLSQHIHLKSCQQFVLQSQLLQNVIDAYLLSLQLFDDEDESRRRCTCFLFQPQLHSDLFAELFIVYHCFKFSDAKQRPLIFILLFLFHSNYDESNSHYNMSSNKPGESPQDILKRIEAESAERKRQRTVELLQRKAPQGAGSAAGQWWKATWSSLQAGYAKGKKNFLRMSRIKENRHIAIITLFFTASMWVTWQVEDKYDKLRRRARTSKSMKQKQVQSENEYINRMLAKNPFAPVPIQDEEEQEASYIFQKADIEFDTRADLMEVLQEQNQLLDQED